jgi:mannose-6-phosphate isomerase-like protein (cupin superfamily)
MAVINLADKFGRIEEHWRPKVVAALNGQEVKLVKFEGVFPWHYHADGDELFMVWKGSMQIEFRTRSDDLDPDRPAERIEALNVGELTVVPKGQEHRTVAVTEAEVLIFEPAAVRNTGNVVDDTFTAPTGVTL